MTIGIDRAVVVDDNAQFRELLKMVLGSFGVTQVVEAKDGVEAMRVLDSFDADVVIMDWRMAGMDGITCARRIRNIVLSRNPDLPIVMLSGYGDENDVRKAHDAGVDVYLTKPISMKPLLAGIQKAVSGAAARPRRCDA